MKIEFTITIDEPAKKVAKRKMVKFGPTTFATKETAKEDSKEIISNPMKPELETEPEPETEVKKVEVVPEELSTKTEIERGELLPVFTQTGHKRSNAGVIRTRLDYLEGKIKNGFRHEFLLSELIEDGCVMTLSSFRNELMRARKRRDAKLAEQQSELST